MNLLLDTNKISFVGHLLLFLLIFVYSTTSSPPKIALDLWCEDTKSSEDGKIFRRCHHHDGVNKSGEVDKIFESFNNNGTRFTFINSPKQLTTTVAFNCTASYPIRWKLTQTDLLWGGTELGINLIDQFVVYTVYGRSAINVSDMSTFTYTAVLHIHNDNQHIGEYKCERFINGSNSNPEESASTSIFVKNNFEGKIFLLDGKNWTVSLDDSGKIVFPCNVFDPNVSVNLLKENKSLNRWEPVPVDKSSLIYKPEIGFIYRKNQKNVNGFQLTVGNYQCSSDTKTNTEGPKFVNITLLSGYSREESKVKYRVTHPAKFSAVTNGFFGRATVTCCSANKTPPELKVIKCEDKINCAEKFIYDPNLTLGYLEDVKEDRNCAKVDDLTLSWISAVNVRCSGDGVDVVKTLLFPELNYRVNDPSDSQHNGNEKSAYHSFEEADPREMIRFGTAKESKPELKVTKSGQIVLVDGETIKIWCSASRAYFEDGMFIMINYKNGTFERIKDQQNERFNYNSDIRISKAMKSFTCFAPKLFSTKWINKSMEILVEDQQPVKIVGNTAVKNIILRGNETIDLICNFEGSAFPNKSYWVKNGQKICHGNGEGDDIFPCLPISPLKNSMKLLLSMTPKSDLAGEYTCYIGNILGYVHKTFKITTEN